MKCYLLTSSARHRSVPAVTWWSLLLDDKVLPDYSLDVLLKVFDVKKVVAPFFFSLVSCLSNIYVNLKTHEVNRLGSYP